MSAAARGGSVMSAGAGDVGMSPLPHGTVPGHSDITFTVEGRHVRLHKAILAARSEYFRSKR